MFPKPFGNRVHASAEIAIRPRLIGNAVAKASEAREEEILAVGQYSPDDLLARGGIDTRAEMPRRRPYPIHLLADVEIPIAQIIGPAEAGKNDETLIRRYVAVDLLRWRVHTGAEVLWEGKLPVSPSGEVDLRSAASVRTGRAKVQRAVGGYFR